MNNIRCELCKHWKLTKPITKIGDCSIYNIQTEWCAGTVFQIKTIIKFCPYFTTSKKDETLKVI